MGNMRRRLILWIIFGVVMIALSVGLFHRLNFSKRYAKNTQTDFLRFAEKIYASNNKITFVDIDVMEDLTEKEIGGADNITHWLLKSIPKGGRGKLVTFSLNNLGPGIILEPRKWSRHTIEKIMSDEHYQKTTKEGVEIYTHDYESDVVIADRRIYSGQHFLNIVMGDNKPEEVIASKKDFIEVVKHISSSAFEVNLRKKTDRLFGILDRATWWLSESCRSPKGLYSRTIIMFDTEEDALSAFGSDEVKTIKNRNEIAAKQSPPPKTVFVAAELDRSGKAVILTSRFKER